MLVLQLKQRTIQVFDRIVQLGHGEWFCLGWLLFWFNKQICFKDLEPSTFESPSLNIYTMLPDFGCELSSARHQQPKSPRKGEGEKKKKKKKKWSQREYDFSLIRVRDCLLSAHRHSDDKIEQQCKLNSALERRHIVVVIIGVTLLALPMLRSPSSLLDAIDDHSLTKLWQSSQIIISPTILLVQWWNPPSSLNFSFSLNFLGKSQEVRIYCWKTK